MQCPGYGPRRGPPQITYPSAFSWLGLGWFGAWLHPQALLYFLSLAFCSLKPLQRREHVPCALQCFWFSASLCALTYSDSSVLSVPAVDCSGCINFCINFYNYSSCYTLCHGHLSGVMWKWSRFSWERAFICTSISRRIWIIITVSLYTPILKWGKEKYLPDCHIADQSPYAYE